MKVNDLYIIVRELQHINILQHNTLHLLGKAKSTASVEQEKAYQTLNEILEHYERYTA